jgi:hypothetical protein
MAILAGDAGQSLSAFLAVSWQFRASRAPMLRRLCRAWEADFLRVNAALPDRVRHAVNRQHVSGDAIVHVMGFGVAHDIFE